MMGASRSATFAWLCVVVALIVAGCSSSGDEPRVGETAQALTSGPTISTFTPNHAAQGTAITITGSGFTGASSVVFAGTSATFSVTNDTTIAVTVPNGAQTGTVAVTAASGTGTSKATFKVTPTLASFVPTSGGPGTLVVVHGTGLLGATAVVVAGTAATFAVVNDTAVDVTIDAGTGNGAIAVTTPGGSVASAQPYAAGGPTISTFTAQGKQGATVTITGTGFANVGSVTFGGVPSASLTSVTEPQIKAVVPSGALTGPIVVSTALGSATTSTAFNVTPTVTSLSPTNGAPGQVIDIVGTGLQQTSSVAFGTASTTAAVVSDSEIKATVPPGAATGKIVLTTAGGTATSGGTFTLQSVPVLSSFSPASAAQGATVTITGTNMLGANAVTFNGVAATISSSNATAVKVVVPVGATTGIVTVSNEAGTGASATTYPIVPKLVSFAPTSGAAGASITINGSAFTGATGVTFGTVSAAFSVGNDATLSALVPVGAANGKIVVTTAGGAATSPTAFQVLSPPTITSFSPTSATTGSTITIHGTAFTGATSVLFDGAAAASFKVTSATVMTAVVPTSASTGPIAVTTPAGTATSAASLTLPANKCTGIVCSALDACHVAGTCNAATGICSNPAAANGTSCNDGNSCTQTDTCQAGVCSGSNPVTCTAADACHTAGTCNAATGTCTTPTAPDGTSCNDRNACTQTDSCQAGVCSGANPISCAAADSCHVAGACNPTTGACTRPTASDGTACNDGNACTQGDACTAGACAGTPLTCPASDACHVAGACSATSGCSNPAAADGTSCSDGNACNGAETCSKGTCTAGTPPTNNPSCSGGSSQLLPPPPVSVNTASAKYSSGGVDFIDPNSVLSAGITVTTLPGAPADLLGSDVVYQFAPASTLPGVVDARFTFAAALPAGTVPLLWTRAGSSGPFTLQSIGRIDPTGLLVSFQLTSLGQESITLLGSGMAYQAPGTGDGTTLVGIAPQSGDGSFITLGGNLTVTNAGRIAVASPGIARPQDGSPSLASSGEAFGNGNAVYEISGGVLQTFAQSVTSAQAASTGDIVVQSADWDLSFDQKTFASDAFSPSISADGKTVTYTNSDQQIAYGMTSPQVLSVAPDGTPGNSNSAYSVVARGGRWVAFESSSTNLDPTDPTPGVYLRDLSKAGPAQHLEYAQPSAYLADCSCTAASGCAADTPESQGGCLAGQIPFAISDGGRYVFLEDDIASDPIPPRTQSLVHDLTYSLAPCVNAYRLDRVTGAFDAVAYGDWFGVDRGGRTILSHHCHVNDVLENDDLGIALIPLTVRDMAVGTEIPVPVTGSVAQAFEQANGYPLPLTENLNFEWGLTAAGTMTGDGNTAFYVVDGFNTEQYTWEAWKSSVPSVIAGPTVSLGSTIEFKPTPVTYSGMLGQAPGDMFVLLDANGNAINAYPTNGATSGTFQMQALPDGNYFLDAYVALVGDPNILKFVSRNPFTVAPPTPTLTVANPLCEFAAFDVQFSNFLALTPDDYVDFGSVDFFGNFSHIESQAASSAASGTLHFTSNVTAGSGAPASYALKVYYGMPDGSGTQLAATMPLSFTVCQVALGVVSAGLSDDCDILDPLLESTFERVSTSEGISPDGRFLVYVSASYDVHVVDRGTEPDQDTVIASNIASFGVTSDAMHFAYMFDAGSQIYIASTTDPTTQTQVPVPPSAPLHSSSIHMSLDAKTVAVQVTTINSYVEFQNIYAAHQVGGAWTSALPVDSAPGCFPTLTDDGESLLFITSTAALADCSDNGANAEFRPVLMSIAAPQSQAACPAPGAIDTGEIDLGNGTPDFEAPVESAQIAPNGSGIAFFATFDPWGVAAWPMENPPSSEPGEGLYGFTQGLDGSNRFYFGVVVPSQMYLDGSGNLFFSTYDQTLYRQAPGSAPVVVANQAVFSMFVSPSAVHRIVTSSLPGLSVQSY